MSENTSALEAKTIPFGTVFADRMVTSTFRESTWSPISHEELAPLSLHPACHVLHYSSSCFEGLKAYRLESGSVGIFRLDRHIRRMRQSAELLCLPVPEADMLEEMIVSLVSECRDAVPEYPGSLYLRPTLIGTEPSIGAAAAPSSEALLYVFASQVGAYFETGARPLKLLVEEEAMRSTPSFGMAKTGGNYASALHHIVEARRNFAVDQVLFCPGGDVQETGATNFMLVNDQTILTKSLDASFLPGVTRDSVLALARSLGYEVLERPFTVNELLQWLPTGEALLTGTAAVIAGVGSVIYRGEEHRAGSGEIGPNTLRLHKALTDIQRGAVSDPLGWLRSV
ncbi:MAG: branched-chain amino acid aminotransferase [Thermoanaerobaculia bacterium]